MQLEKKLTVIAGPCLAESYDMMAKTAETMMRLQAKHHFHFVFKSSFDKANRSSHTSYRGPGMDQALEWMAKIKQNFGCDLTTDIHETHHVDAVAQIVDVLQIPAFLCRQTDLVLAAVKTRRRVNVKKGQFMAPESMANVVAKAKNFAEANGFSAQVSLTERGFCFGYGDLVVDPRSFPIMAQNNVPVYFDVTHSTQRPPAGETITGALRSMAPILARAATATGYLDGYFIETHPNPSAAKSDKESQLSFAQIEALLDQLVPLWETSRAARSIDSLFR